MVPRVWMMKNALNMIAMQWYTKCTMTHERSLADVQICLNPFDTGSVEQWLKFLMKLNLIITRNGLMASLVKFNLTWLLLKGEALRHFNNKAEELKNETNVHHKLCISMVSKHIFPKNALQMQ